jgi:peptide deformylase
MKTSFHTELPCVMSQGSFNRREFLKHSLAGMALVAGGLVPVGCGRSADGLQIVLYPDPRLRMVAKPVDVIGQEVLSLVKGMKELLVSKSQRDFFTIGSMHPGLAAPQIGVAKRIIVCGFHGELKTLINPEITSRNGVYNSEEKCLSLPSSPVTKVQRSKRIKVSYYNLNNEQVSLELRDRYAALVEHEIDHLNGRLYIDY